MKQALVTKIPFSGFYDSLYSGEVDHCQEMDCEHYAEKEAEDHPKELRIEASEFADIFFDCADYSAAYHAVAKEYVEAFDTVVSDEIGIKLDLSFENMSSPREYNFETDRIFVHIPRDVVAKLFRASRADKHETLAAVIKKRFTGCSGYIPFYRNELDTWLAKPVSQWDHNELETLLLAVMRINGVSANDDDLAIFYRTTENEGAFNAWSNCVDWAKFDAKCAELRGEKEEEHRASVDPDYVAPAPRCPDTIDMFGGR